MIYQYTNNAAYAPSSVYAGKEYNPAICLTTDYSFTHGYMHTYIAIATNITAMMMMMTSVHPSIYIIAMVFIHTYDSI